VTLNGGCRSLEVSTRMREQYESISFLDCRDEGEYEHQLALDVDGLDAARHLPVAAGEEHALARGARIEESNVVVSVRRGHDIKVGAIRGERLRKGVNCLILQNSQI
jgi:hypothetical protein